MNTKQKDTNKKVFPYIQNSYLVKIVLRLSKILFGSTVAQINHLTYKLELYQNYTYFPTLSPSIKKMAVESFDIPEDKVIVTGSPRNDALFDKKINIVKLKDLTGLNLTDTFIYPHYTNEVEDKIKKFENKYQCKVGRLNDNQSVIIEKKR